MEEPEEIKTIQNDIGKSADNPDPIVKGKRTYIGVVLHEWNGKTWIPVEEEGEEEDEKSED